MEGIRDLKIDLEGIRDLKRDLEVQYIANKYSEYTTLDTHDGIAYVDYHEIVIYLDREYEALLKRLEREGK